ncbi:hypothetical protein [Crenobacter cavernae]|uniref:hypothetical protein n=1 Tax=Crenobacter cavernae TaxID=2290923 RepID=UPI00196B2073|nr:hypothetical protein [Crenobacter cavernae]
MKTIGLIGGGWESSAAYYQRLNRGVEARLGLPHAIKPEDTRLPLYESTDLHVAAALDFMLGGDA